MKQIPADRVAELTEVAMRAVATQYNSKLTFWSNVYATAGANEADKKTATLLHNIKTSTERDVEDLIKTLVASLIKKA